MSRPVLPKWLFTHSATISRRRYQTLSSNRHINVFPGPKSNPQSYILTYLKNDPPSASLAIGTSTTVPPTPQTFQENERFKGILKEVVEEHGHEDEDVIAQARAYSVPGGISIGSGGAFSPLQHRHPQKMQKKREGVIQNKEKSAEGPSTNLHRGGWVHLSDRRNPPDFGRIAWPEDILGSVEVNGEGEVVGKAQASGTYRILTNEGILGISDSLRQNLVRRLQQEEARGSRS